MQSNFPLLDAKFRAQLNKKWCGYSLQCHGHFVYTHKSDTFLLCNRGGFGGFSPPHPLFRFMIYEDLSDTCGCCMELVVESLTSKIKDQFLHVNVSRSKKKYLYSSFVVDLFCHRVFPQLYFEGYRIRTNVLEFPWQQYFQTRFYCSDQGTTTGLKFHTSIL